MNETSVAEPGLRTAVHEIETHVAAAGWDQPARLYALVETASLVRREPSLAAAMHLDAGAVPGALTPIEQDQLPPDRQIEEVLESISWPPEVAGCAAVVERLVLPPGADADLPAEASEAEKYAREHPHRQEVRIAAGVTRGGATYCALRLRAHDDDQSVVGGADLVPGLVSLLGATLVDESMDEPDVMEESPR